MKYNNSDVVDAIELIISSSKHLDAKDVAKNIVGQLGIEMAATQYVLPPMATKDMVIHAKSMMVQKLTRLAADKIKTEFQTRTEHDDRGNQTIELRFPFITKLPR